jgi:hypothetical protein
LNSVRHRKNKITRRWAKRGTRPCAPRDQRTAFTYIFGAVCPKEGKGAALILPTCNTEAMNLHLVEIAATVAPGAHGLSNRVFKSYDDLVDHCCVAWNKLVNQPWRIMSIGLRQWAHRF